MRVMRLAMMWMASQSACISTQYHNGNIYGMMNEVSSIILITNLYVMSKMYSSLLNLGCFDLRAANFDVGWTQRFCNVRFIGVLISLSSKGIAKGNKKCV